MQQLSEQGRQRIDELAQSYSVSTDAVMTVLQSLVTAMALRRSLTIGNWGMAGNGCGAA